MNLLEQFKSYLFSQEEKPSKVTVKNYSSDINHFIKWFEKQYGTFLSSPITNKTLEEYKSSFIEVFSPASMQRHLSSLRKFFKYLKLEDKLAVDPFEASVINQKHEVDIWKLKDFKNNLYVDNAAHLTIKNYIIDVKQFVSWAKEVTGLEDNLLINLLDKDFVEEYKKRLIEVGEFSPATVNRKLSSLRKYLSFAVEVGLVTQNLASVANINEIKSKLYIPKKDELGSTQVKSEPTAKHYSSFPPLRLLQKVGRGIGLGFDLVFTSPLASFASKAQETIWKLRGKPLFKKGPVTLVTKNITHQDLLGIRNISKRIYAPFKISTASFSPIQKLIFHLRYTRPNWYKKYHSYAIAHYLNFAVLIIFLATVGFGLYNSFFAKPQSQPALAVLPTAPPRILSFQGRLTDNNDNPITSNTNIRFAIYNNLTASGAALLWQEVDPVTPDVDGIFNVLLGNVTSIPSTLFSENAALYLGVTIEATPELTPRQQLATVAYATNSETLQGLPPITAAGASTSNVVLALDSSGNLTIGGSANPSFSASGGQFKLSGQPLLLTTNTGTDANVQITTDDLGKIDLQKPILNTTNSNNIATAIGAVEVNDLFAVLATSSGQSALTINQTSTGPIISASSGGTAKFTIDNSGNEDLAGNLTAAGTTGISLSGNGAGITFSGTGNHDITASSGTLRLGAFTLTGAVTGNSQSITGLNNLSAAGTITFSNFNANNNVIYATVTTGVLAGANTSTTGLCLVSGASAPSWSSCSGAATTELYWSQANGTLYANNSTVDLLIGGQATSSAKFAVLNINSGTPIASVSSGLSGNGAYLTADGTLATTRRQSLTIGNSSTYNTTGNVLINSNGTGNVGIGTTSPNDKLNLVGDVRLTDNTPNLGFQSPSDVYSWYIGANISDAVDGGWGVWQGGKIGTGTNVFLINSSANITMTGTTITASSLTSMTTGAAFAISGTSYVKIGDTGTPGSATADDDLYVQGALEVDGTIYAQGNSIQSSTAEALSLSADDVSVVGCLNVGSATECTTQGNIQGSGLLVISGSGTSTIADDLDIADRLAIGGSAGISTDRLINANESTALTNSATYTSVIQRTLTGTLTGSFSSYGSYGGLTINATDDKFSHTAYGSFSFASLSSGNTIDGMYAGYFSADNNSSALSADLGRTATTSAAVYGLARNLGANSLIASQYGGLFASYGAADGSVITSSWGSYGASITTVDEAYITTAYGVYGTSYENLPMAGGAGITTNYGGYFIAQDATTSAGLIAIGTQNSTRSEDTTFTNTYGGRLQCQVNSSTVTITNCYGLSAEILGTAGTITNAYGINVANPTSTGTITTSYGIRVADQTGTNIGTAYGIYVAGADDYALYVAADDAAFLDDVYVGSTTTAITDSGFSPDNNDAYFDGDIGVNGTTYLDGNIDTLFTGNNAAVYGTVTTGVLASATTSTANLCLVSGATTPSWASCNSAGTDPFWNQGSGALFPNNSTVDLLIGGQSTTSAKFAILGVNSARGSQTASLSGDFVFDKAASIETTNGQTLTLGGSATGLVNINNKSGSAFTTFNTVNSRVGIGTDAPVGKLSIYDSSATDVGISFQSASGNRFWIAQNTSGIWLSRGAAITTNQQYFYMDSGGKLGLGTITPSSKLHVTRALADGATGKALAIFDQIENQDILTASKSGVTKFVIDQNGQLGVNTDTPDSILDVVAADPILIVRDTDTSLTTANTRLRLAESGASDALDNYWDLKAEKVGAGDNFSFHIASNGLGEVFSIAASDGDVGIGTTTPTATLDVAGAASVGGQLTFRNVTSAIQTTYNNTLTIGGNTTGNIILSPLNNTGKVGINITPASTVLAFQVGATYTAVASGSTIANVNATMNTDQADNRGFGAQVSFNPTTSLDTIRGSLILPNVNSSNMTVTSFTAVDARVDIAANFSGIVTNGYGFRALNPSDTGAGAFVNYIGLQVSALTVATNSAGISVGNAASTGNNVNLLLGTTTIPTGDFSLYSSSSYDSYFSGNVGFGDTSPSSQVEIGDGTDSIQFSSVGDITFVDANSTASITGPAGGALNITAGAGGVALVLGSDTTGDLYYRSSGGILARLAVGTGTQCLVGGTNPAWGSCNASGTDVYWQQTNGALYPSNSTVDLFVGGQASTSAKFAVLDVNGAGAATASVSGNLIVMARNGDGGNVGIGTVNPLNRLTVALGNNQIAQLNDATNASAIWGMNFGIISEASEARLTTAGSLPIVFYTGGTRNSVAEGTERMRIDTSGNLSLATGTSITASSLTTLTTSAAVDWATLTSLTFSADNALISGSDAANGNLSLQGTTNATRTTSYLLLQPNGGNVGIGDSTPSQLFVVGSGDLFQVDSSGNALAPTLALGNGTIARTDRLFDFNDTSSDINTKTYTGSILRTITGTITANRTDYGIYNVVTNNSSDDMFSHTLYGAYNQSTLSSGYTIDVIYGLQGASVISSAQLQPISNLTATLSAGLVGTSNLNAAGTVSSNIGVYALAQNSNASGTVSLNDAARFIAYVTADGATVTTNRGVYAQSYENGDYTSNGIVTGYAGYFDSRDATTTYGIFARGIQDSGLSETFTNVYGIYGQCQSGSAGTTINNCYGVTGILSSSNATSTIDTGYTFYASNPTSTGTLTTNYGMLIADQTGGDTSDYGIAIAGADTQVLWLSSGADNTDAANGIAFGLSRDTNLYRSAANTLRTDDAFNINGTANISSAGVASGLTGITSSGTITFSGLNGQNATLYGTQTTGVLAQATTSNSNLCLVSGASAPSWGSCNSAGTDVFWSQTNGTLYANNSTVDLLIGGQATTSAKFAVLNINSGTPTASISANSGNNAVYLTGDGTLATTNRGTITIGSSSTYNTSGNILLAPNGTGNVGIGTTGPGRTLDLRGTSVLADDDVSANSYYGASGDQNIIAYTGNQSAFATFVTNTGLTNSVAEIGAVRSASSAYWLLRAWVGNGTTSAFSTQVFGIRGDGNVGLGTTSPISELHVTRPLSFGATGKALAIFDQIESQDILTASSSGSTKFILANTGDIDTAGSNIELSILGSGNRYSYIDFHGDDTYTDYGLRLIRSNTGANAPSTLYHRGTGDLNLYTQDSASIKFYTASVLAATIDTSNNLTLVGNLAVNGDTITSDADLTLNPAGGDVVLTSDRITWGTTGVAAPTYTSYSAGVKLVLYDSVGASSVGYTIGIQGSTMFFTAATTADQFLWYSGTTNTMQLTGAGNLVTTGTVTAGAYAVLGTSISGGYYQDSSNGAYRAIGTTGDRGYYFQTNAGGATYMYVGLTGTYAGRVGIGTSTPAAPLDIAGGTSATGTIQGSYGIIVSSRDEWLRLNDDDGAGDYHTQGIYMDGPYIGTQSCLEVGFGDASCNLAGGINSNAGYLSEVGGAFDFMGKINSSGGGYDSNNNGTYDLLVYDGGNIYFNQALTGYGGTANITTYDTNENLTIDPNGSGYVYIPNGTFYVQDSSILRGGISDDGGDLLLADNVQVSGGTLYNTTSLSISGDTSGSGTNQLYLNNGGVTGMVVNTAGRAEFNLSGTATANGLCHSGGDADSALGATDRRIVVVCSGTPGDIAEWYPVNEQLESGYIVSTSQDLYEYDSEGATFTGEIISTGRQKLSVLQKADSENMPMGIVSTAPWQIFGADVKKALLAFPSSGIKPLPIALSGRVPVKITTENGDIHEGDFITLSSTPGVGMKATRASYAVGRALEDSVPNKDTIMVFVQFTYYNPDIQLTDTGNLNIVDASPSANFDIEHSYVLNDPFGLPIDRIGAFGEIVVAKLRAGLVSAQQISTNSLTVTTENITIAGQNIRDYIASIVSQQLSSTTYSPIANVDEIHTGFISPISEEKEIGIQIDKDKVSIVNGTSATHSAVAVFDNLGNATLSGKLTSKGINTQDASVSGVLRARRIIADQIEGLDVKASTVSANYITNITNVYNNSTQSAFPTLPVGNESPSESSSNSGSFSTLFASNNYINIASFASQLAFVESLNTVNQIVSSDLSVFGSTTLSDTSIVGQLAIGGNLILSDESINVLGGDLSLQPLRQGGLSIMAGLIYVDTNGNMKVGNDLEVNGTLFANQIAPLPGKDLTFKLSSASAETNKLIVKGATDSAVLSIDNLGNLIASGAASIAKLNLNNIVGPALAVSPTEIIATGSAGTARINANRLEMTINNPLVTEKSLIYITPTSNTGNQVLYLLRQTPGESFTVGIENPSAVAIPFNWIIVN